MAYKGKKEIKVISIGGKAPKVTTVGRRKIYSSQDTEVITDRRGKITSLIRTTKTSNKLGPINSNKGVTTEQVIDSTGRTLTPFETAAVKATSGEMTSAETGQAVYSSVSVERSEKANKPNFIDVAQKETVRKGLNKVAAKETFKEKIFTGAIKSNPVIIGSPVASFVDDAYSFTKDLKGSVNAPLVSNQGLRESMNLLVTAEPSVSANKNYFSDNPFTKSFGRSQYKLAAVSSLAGVGVYKQAVTPLVTRYATALKTLPKATQKVVNLGASLGVTYGVSEGVESAGNAIVKVSSPNTKDFFNTGQARGAFEAGINAERSQAGFVDRQLLSIPIANKLVKRDDDLFASGVKAYASDQGIVNTDSLIKSARQVENVQTASFASGLLSANTFSEIGGQVALSGKAVPATFKGRFWQGFKTISNQGFIEGSSSVVAEQTASGKNPKTFNYPAIAAGAAIGAVTAGTIGGVIYAAPPTISKTLLGASYVADPFEVAGDFTASSASRVLTPALSFSGGRTASLSTPTSSNNVVSSSNTITNTFTAVDQPTNVFTPVNTPTNTFVNSNIFTSTRANVLSNTYTPTNAATPTNTFVNTPVNTPTNTFVNTPTVTGRKEFLLFPPIFGGGGSNKKFGFGFTDSLKQRRTYQASLTAKVLNIKGSRPSAFGIKTGLVVRPIL